MRAVGYCYVAGFPLFSLCKSINANYLINEAYNFSVFLDDFTSVIATFLYIYNFNKYIYFYFLLISIDYISRDVSFHAFSWKSVIFRIAGKFSGVLNFSGVWYRYSIRFLHSWGLNKYLLQRSKRKLRHSYQTPVASS